MFHINDLNDMDDTLIRETAESMGIKKTSSLSRDQIIDQILDLQADASVEDFRQKNADKKKPAKEPRARKTQKANAQETSVAEKQNASMSDEATASGETLLPAPKRRGRKPKSTENIQAEDVANTPAEKTAVEKTAGKKVRVKKSTSSETSSLPMLAENTPADSAAAEIQPSSETSESSSQNDNTEITPAVNNTQDSSVTSKREEPEHPKLKIFTPRNQKTSADTLSLTSFFTPSKGKTFMPRGQRDAHREPAPLPQPQNNMPEPVQDELAALPTPQAEPIQLREPGATSQQPLTKQQKNMLKKQQRMLRQQGQPVPP